MTEGVCRVKCFVRTRVRRYAGAAMSDRRSLACLALLALTALAACAPPPLWHQPGVATSRLKADLTACRVSALQQVPEARRTRYIPADYILHPVCLPGGPCHWKRVVTRPAQYQTHDANEALRADVVQVCMAEKGYARARLPACTAPEGAKITVTGTDGMPPLTEASCALRLASGEWRIVTPAAP